MAFLPRPVTIMMFSIPEAAHSSTAYWISGLSTMGSISLGCAFVAGRKRVPRPAAGKTAVRTGCGLFVTVRASKNQGFKLRGAPEVVNAADGVGGFRWRVARPTGRVYPFGAHRGACEDRSRLWTAT